MKSAVQVFSFDLVAKIFIGITGITLIRFMGASEYASYTLAVSAAAVTAQALGSTFNRLYIVGQAKLGPHDSPSAFLGLQAWVLLLVLVLSLPLIRWVGENYWLIALLSIATCLSESSKTFYQRDLKFVRYSLVEIVRALLFAGAVVVLVLVLGHGLRSWQVLAAQSAVMLAVFLMASFRHLELQSVLRVETVVQLGSRMLTGSYGHLFAYFFALAFFSQADVFMLKYLGDDAALATYGSAFRYYSLLLMALGAVHAVLLPVIQKVQSLAELDSVLVGHRRMILIFAPLVLIGAWLSQWVIPWIDMGKYPDAVPVFRILAVSAIVSFAFSPHVNLVMRFEDFQFLLGLVTFALLLSVALNWLLIPIFGAIGAAVTTLLTFGIVNWAIFLRARKHRALIIA